jgi:hypothetical protein
LQKTIKKFDSSRGFMPKKQGDMATKVSNSLTSELALWGNLNGYNKVIAYSSKELRLLINLETGNFAISAVDEASKSNIEIVMNLANQIGDLPSDALEILSYTKDLQHEFNRHRNDSIMIGKCFAFASLNISIDPLKKEKACGYVNQWTKEILIQTAYRYRALHELIKVGFEDIKKVLPDISFDTPEKLCFEIIRDERDSYFEKLVGSDFVEILTNAVHDIWQGIQQGESWETLNKKSINKGLGFLYKGALLHKCLDILYEKAEKNSAIRNRLRAYSQECDSLTETIMSTLKARSSRGKVKKSVQWKLGTVHTFDKSNQPSIPLRTLQNFMG